jgi:glutathione S-transferase
VKITHLKLYHYPASRSARVKWMLHEVVGEAFEVEKIALYDGEQYGPEFVQMNPNHNVPVLTVTWEDGRTLHMIESAAMVAFLADAYPENGLAPPPGASPERADYLQMLHFGGTWMDMMLWQVRAHEHVLPDDERDERTVARYRRKFAQEVEPQLARRLQASPHVCGEVHRGRLRRRATVPGRVAGCRDEIFRYFVPVVKRPACSGLRRPARDSPAVRRGGADGLRR